MKLPIISLAILGGQIALANSMGASMVNKLNTFQTFYTGINLEGGGERFMPERLIIGYVPWLAKRFILPLAAPGRSLARLHLPVSLS